MSVCELCELLEHPERCELCDELPELCERVCSCVRVSVCDLCDPRDSGGTVQGA